jgi:hypothetical protein
MTSKYTIKAHATIYKNIQFRSRLEAIRAAYFDLVEWTWEYEPVDLEVEVDGKKLWWPKELHNSGQTSCI